MYGSTMKMMQLGWSHYLYTDNTETAWEVVYTLTDSQNRSSFWPSGILNWWDGVRSLSDRIYWSYDQSLNASPTTTTTPPWTPHASCPRRGIIDQLAEVVGRYYPPLSQSETFITQPLGRMRCIKIQTYILEDNEWLILLYRINILWVDGFSDYKCSISF